MFNAFPYGCILNEMLIVLLNSLGFSATMDRDLAGRGIAVDVIMFVPVVIA